ncbi:MAG: replication-associated recombination protein A [Deltaproteobacteria bacterium]|nr:MAG: replication-associated recombination protein A [Deltaproteobacteria bacterium]
MDLFRHGAAKQRRGQPLAERMRPTSLDEFVGQAHLLGPGKLLARALEGGVLPSLILWGPPGSGKTTLARILARHVRAELESLSAVQAGVKDIREVVARAASRRDERGRATVLFIDEIHRFSKAQQDALLPHVEDGTVVLIGATTENPSFEVNAPLLSRARVLRLEPLSDADIAVLVRRACARELRGVTIEDAALAALVRRAEGDARRALNALEVAAAIADGGEVTVAAIEEALQAPTLRYDRRGEEHYNVVSAFIKSVRGSDPDAAVYWMARMLEAGEDPRFVARRLVILASEDIGNADPQALVVAEAAHRAFEFVGMPEGVLPLTQAALYLARAPKSNEVLTAYARARRWVRDYGALPVPMKLRNAPTALMKQMGYGRGYKYPHEFDGNYVEGETYLPDELVDRLRAGDGDGDDGGT